MAPLIDCKCKGISPDCPTCFGRGYFDSEKAEKYKERRKQYQYPVKKVHKKNKVEKINSSKGFKGSSLDRNIHVVRNSFDSRSESVLINDLIRNYKSLSSSNYKGRKSKFREKIRELKLEYKREGYNVVLLKKLELKYEKSEKGNKKKKKSDSQIRARARKKLKVKKKQAQVEEKKKKTQKKEKTPKNPLQGFLSEDQLKKIKSLFKD